jgi:hypothetical protein
MFHHGDAFVRLEAVGDDVNNGRAYEVVAFALLEPGIAEAERVGARPYARAEFRLDAGFLAEFAAGAVLRRFAWVQAAAGSDPDGAGIVKALVLPAEKEDAVAVIEQDHARRGSDDRLDAGMRLRGHGGMISGGGIRGLTNRTGVLY